MRAMRALFERPLPEDLLTTYKRYERGKHFSTTYASLLAAVFGTDTESLLGRRRPERRVFAAATPQCLCGAGQAAPIIPLRAPADQSPGSLAGYIVAGLTNHQPVLVTGRSSSSPDHCILQLRNLGHQPRTTVRSPAREDTEPAVLTDAGMTQGDALTFAAADPTSNTSWAAAATFVLHLASRCVPATSRTRTTRSCLPGTAHRACREPPATAVSGGSRSPRRSTSPASGHPHSDHTFTEDD